MTHDDKRSRIHGDDPKDMDGLLTWAWVSAQMTKSRSYWVSSTRPDGNPHAAPVWGVWVDESFYFGTEPTSRKAKNFAHNPNIVVHLESGDETVIFEGVVTAMTADEPVQVIFAAYRTKYTPYDPAEDIDPAQPDGMYSFKPKRVLAWLEKDFPKTATRWTF